MSAYVCDGKTFARIVRGLEMAGDGDGFNAPPRPDAILPDWQKATAKERRAMHNALSVGLFAVNVASVRARYENADKSGMIPPDAGKCGRVSAVSPVQLYKSIRGWLYQSCESADTRSNHLYMALESYSRDLAEWIVDRSPEYEAAEWA